MRHHFAGLPKPSDFEVATEPLPALKAGQVLTEARFWSVDPYARVYPLAFGFKLPMTMLGSQVAEVIESKNPRFPVGCLVVAYTGWRDRHVVDPEEDQSTYGEGPFALPKVSRAIDLPAGISASHLLGALGMPGNSAYFGLIDICQPKSGETVCVSGAGGAVGHLVGQIAKAAVPDCRVVGYAGSDEKCDWLKQELGFHAAINYKKGNVRSSLKRSAPDGVDCYFDNVGGPVSTATLMNMNLFGRVAVCGAIASYNDTRDDRLLEPPLQPLLVTNQLRMEGFVVWRWMRAGRWNEGLQQLAQWMDEGKIKTRETIMEGFENLPTAFIGMLSGDNTGKMIVKAARHSHD